MQGSVLPNNDTQQDIVEIVFDLMNTLLVGCAQERVISADLELTLTLISFFVEGSLTALSDIPLSSVLEDAGLIDKGMSATGVPIEPTSGAATSSPSVSVVTVDTISSEKAEGAGFSALIAPRVVGNTSAAPTPSDVYGATKSSDLAHVHEEKAPTLELEREGGCVNSDVSAIQADPISHSATSTFTSTPSAGSVVISSPVNLAADNTALAGSATAESAHIAPARRTWINHTPPPAAKGLKLLWVRLPEDSRPWRLRLLAGLINIMRSHIVLDGRAIPFSGPFASNSIAAIMLGEQELYYPPARPLTCPARQALNNALVDFAYSANIMYSVSFGTLDPGRDLLRSFYFF